MLRKRAVIIANGDLVDLDFYRSLLKDDDLIICVNGGSGHALALGLYPDLIIGDLDSLKPDDRQKIEQLNPRIIKHPSAKDKSDLELAIDEAVEMQPEQILIIGALGGARADHAFINLLLLQIPLHHGIPARILDQMQEIILVEDEVFIDGNTGDYLSLFSLTAETSGIFTEGLKYPLQGESLYFASTLGLSNELAGPQATITINSGLLLAIKTRVPGRCDVQGID